MQQNYKKCKNKNNLIYQNYMEILIKINKNDKTTKRLSKIQIKTENIKTSEKY